MLFEMHISIEMDRPVSAVDALSPGSFSFLCDQIMYTFDFTMSVAEFGKDKAKVVDFVCKYPDTEAFPLAEKITPEVLRSITSFGEVFIYTGEEANDGPEPLKLLKCEFYIPETDESIMIPQSICNGAYVTRGF